MNRNLILLSMLFALANDMFAQENSPYLVIEGKQWAVCSAIYRDELCYWTDTYRLQGDTVINGKTYLIEYVSRHENLSDMKPSGRYMREVNGKVYSTTDKDQRDNIVFDYTMQVGDTLRYNPDIDHKGNVSMSYQCLLVVATRDTVMPNSDGQMRKCYDVIDGWFDGDVYEFLYDDGRDIHTFIEGVGYIRRGLSEPLVGSVGVGFSLLYVKQGDTMLYQLEEGILWVDNTSVIVPEADKTSFPYYDLQGRPVATPTRGIYIKDGKKVAIK